MKWFSDPFSDKRDIRDVYEENEKTRQLLIEGFESHITASNATTEALQDMHVDVVHGLQSISNQMDTATWELVDIKSAVNRMEATMQSVLDTLTNPERTWAFEQFKYYKENRRKGLRREAIERIKNAIYGHGGTHVGERENPYFHFLLGSLYYEEFIHDTTRNLENCKYAEHSFLLAARYSEHDDKKEATKAYLHAGICAYQCGAVDRALQHIDRAIELNMSLVEAWFQKAKLLCRIGRTDDVFDNLLRPVFEHNPIVYVKVARGDVDISKYKDDLEKTIEVAAHNLHKKALMAKSQTLHCLGEAQDIFSKLKVVQVSDDVLLNIEKVKKVVKNGDIDMKSAAKIEGNWRAHRAYLDALMRYKEVFASFAAGMKDNANREKLKQQAYRPIETRQSRYDKKAKSIAVIGGVACGIVMGLYFMVGGWNLFPFNYKTEYVTEVKNSGFLDAVQHNLMTVFVPLRSWNERHIRPVFYKTLRDGYQVQGSIALLLILVSPVIGFLFGLFMYFLVFTPLARVSSLLRRKAGDLQKKHISDMFQRDLNALLKI